MSEFEKVTVGIPAYNAQMTIGKSLESACNQTWPGPMEILVVDDGSTDATEREVSRCQELDQRIRYEKLPENRGRGEARNHVLRLCGGNDVLAWLDADDIWHSEKIARQMKKLEQLIRSGVEVPGVILTCPYRRRSLQSHGHEDLFPPDFYDIKDVLELGSKRLPALQIQTMLGAAEAWRAVNGFDAVLNWAEDYEYFIRWSDNGGRIYSVQCDQPLVIYNHTLVGLDTELIISSQDYISKKHTEIFERHGVDWNRERAFRAFHYLFNIYLHNNKHFMAWKSALRAAWLYPDDFRGLLMKRILQQSNGWWLRFIKSLRRKKIRKQSGTI